MTSRALKTAGNVVRFTWAGVFALGCATPRPTDRPLGWGPLTPEMRTDRLVIRKPGGSDADARAKKSAPVADEPDETPAPGKTSQETASGSEPKKEEAPSPGPSAATPAAAPVPATAFVGNYAGEDTAVYAIPGMPERTEKDPNAKITVKSPGEQQVAFVLVDSSNGSEICTLNATTADGTANITPGQKCFEQSDADASTSATVTKGVATLKDAHLVVNVTLDFVLRAADKDLAGALEYHFDGTRH